MLSSEERQALPMTHAPTAHTPLTTSGMSAPIRPLSSSTLTQLLFPPVASSDSTLTRSWCREDSYLKSLPGCADRRLRTLSLAKSDGGALTHLPIAHSSMAKRQESPEAPLVERSFGNCPSLAESCRTHPLFGASLLAGARPPGRKNDDPAPSSQKSVAPTTPPARPRWSRSLTPHYRAMGSSSTL